MRIHKRSLTSSTKKTPLQGVRSIASQGLSKRYKYALIVGLALCAVSCRSTKTTESEKLRIETIVKHDTLTQFVKTQTYLPIKADTAYLEVNVDALRQLPSKAVYTAKRGRATVRVERTEGGQVVVYATCDSLEREVLRYEQLTRYWQDQYQRKAQEQLKKSSQTVKHSKFRLWALLIGALAAVCFVVINRLKKKRV